MLKRVVTLDKPIYAGATILDHSKEHMYHYHYNVFQPMFGAENIRVGGSDTDSFMYTITCHNLDQRIWENREHFDLSNYPKDHPLYCTENKKVLGKFKNELAGHVISERVNLRSKLYAFKLAQSDESELRCKGVKKVVVKKTLECDHYREVLQTQTSISREQVQLRSYNHRVFTIRSNKTALSSYDDNRYIGTVLTPEPMVIGAMSMGMPTIIRPQ